MKKQLITKEVKPLARFSSDTAKEYLVKLDYGYIKCANEEDQIRTYNALRNSSSHARLAYHFN